MPQICLYFCRPINPVPLVSPVMSINHQAVSIQNSYTFKELLLKYGGTVRGCGIELESRKRPYRNNCN